MRSSAIIAAVVASASVGASFPSHAAGAWNEGVQGDLSDDRLAPTAVLLAPGASATVAGTMGGGDTDYFSFDVPQGWLLSALQVNEGTSVAGAASFIAIQAGPQITVTASGGGTGTGSLLAFGHYDAGDVGTNLLGRLLPQSSGLAAGTYSVWLNETAGNVPYSFDLVLTAVPEPAVGWLLGCSVLMLGLGRRGANRGGGR